MKRLRRVYPKILRKLRTGKTRTLIRFPMKRIIRPMMKPATNSLLTGL